MKLTKPVTPLNDAHHDGLFFMANQVYTKPPLSIDQQIDFLIYQGLSISDKGFAHHALSVVSYYRLSSYLLPFKNGHHQNGPRTFRQHVNFEQIWDLYQFDRKLRLLTTEAIEKIEVAFRSALTNVTSMRFHPFWYVERQYFKKPKANKGVSKKDFFDDFYLTVKTISKNKQELFIQHYHQKYDEPAFPPIWMMIEALSFGACSKVFDNIQSMDVRNEIASFLG